MTQLNHDYPEIFDMLQTTAPQPEIKLEDHERTPCEVWTRVMGYHQQKARFNLGKQGEFEERTPFNEPVDLAQRI